MLMKGFEARGLEIEDVFSDPESARRAVDAMLSVNVCVSLMTEYHRSSRSATTSTRQATFANTP
jgi:hypothetical protein